MNPAEARRRFSSARVARLATAGQGGIPHVVPITFAVDGNHIYSVIDTKPKHGRRLRRLANVAANPSVALLVDHYDEDWAGLWWVRAEGEAQIVAAGTEAFDRAAVLLRERYPQYRGAVALVGPAIVVRVERWSGWESGSTGGR